MLSSGGAAEAATTTLVTETMLRPSRPPVTKVESHIAHIAYTHSASARTHGNCVWCIMCYVCYAFYLAELLRRRNTRRRKATQKLKHDRRASAKNNLSIYICRIHNLYPLSCPSTTTSKRKVATQNRLSLEYFCSTGGFRKYIL